MTETETERSCRYAASILRAFEDSGLDEDFCFSVLGNAFVRAACNIGHDRVSFQRLTAKMAHLVDEGDELD